MTDDYLRREPRVPGILSPNLSLEDVVSDAQTEARADANRWFGRAEGEQTLEQQRAVNAHRRDRA